MSNNKRKVEEQTRIIGGNLKRLRDEYGYSQKKIAEILDVSFQQVQKYETGKNRIPVENLLRLKIFYQIEFDAFFKGLYVGATQNTPRTTLNDEDQIAASLYEMENFIDKKRVLKALHILTAGTV